MNTIFDEKLTAVRHRWDVYCRDRGFEGFVEFTLALSSLSELLHEMQLPGLARQCADLENAALALFGDVTTHPIDERSVSALSASLSPLLASVAVVSPALRVTPEIERRMMLSTASVVQPAWMKSRKICLIANPDNPWSTGLRKQLEFYGFGVKECDWSQTLPREADPFAVIFVETVAEISEASLARIREIRAQCLTSKLFFAGVSGEINMMVELMRAGIDVTIPDEGVVATLLSRVLDLVQEREQARFRVLLVEDSRVATAQVRRTLSIHGIDCESIESPAGLLAALRAYQPDLILMDMYMPGCNGVEATRVLRQMPAYQSIPVIYLSSETDTALQIEALRLGGDQFLTKPFNPVVLAATINTRIVRHREVQRSNHTDGLTGLLNHTASKLRLDAMVSVLPARGRLTVAMMDIDNFKRVNDTYGHPVGDQVIRSLAWLLKGRLRGFDLIGRYGGEEFIVALADVDADEAWVILDRIRRDFEKLPHAHANGSMNASFSGGIASFPMYRTATELILHADNALMAAKSAGRNRILRDDYTPYPPPT